MNINSMNGSLKKVIGEMIGLSNLFLQKQ